MEYGDTYMDGTAILTWGRRRAYHQEHGVLDPVAIHPEPDLPGTEHRYEA